jgi:DNA-binding NarL/FixJ family response regulator
MDAATKAAIISRYESHVARFERAAEDRRRRGFSAEQGGDRRAPWLPPPPAAEAFTTSETVVLTLIARGFTDTEIGNLIGISANTVKAHVRHVLAKLNARNRAHAVALAVEIEVIKPPYRLRLRTYDRPARIAAPEKQDEGS